MTHAEALFTRAGISPFERPHPLELARALLGAAHVLGITGVHSPAVLHADRHGAVLSFRADLSPRDLAWPVALELARHWLRSHGSRDEREAADLAARLVTPDAAVLVAVQSSDTLADVARRLELDARGARRAIVRAYGRTPEALGLAPAIAAVP